MRTPLVCLALVMASVLIIPGDALSFPSASAAFYRPVAAAPIAPTDALVALLIVGAAFERLRTETRAGIPSLATLALATMMVAVISGMVVGLSNGASLGKLLNAARGPAYLAFIPIATVYAGRRANVAVIFRWCGLCAGCVAVLGLTQWVLRIGHRLPNGEVITYFDAGPLWLLSTVVLSVTVALISGPRVSLAGVLGGLAALTNVALSLRRGFTAALAGGLLAVCLLAPPAVRRQSVILAAAVVVAIGGAVALRPFATASTREAVGGAARVTASFDEIQSERRRGDAYRRAERANVVQNAVRAPLTGLGLAVPWVAYLPLPEENAGGRDYVHVAVLFYWLKMGAVGLAAYVGWMLSFIWLGWSVWRSGVGTLVGAVGLGLAVATACLVIVEATATQVGVDIRLTVMLGIAYGCLLLAEQRRGASGDNLVA